MKNIYIGIDAGTTSIKLMALNQHADVLYEKQYTYTYQTPQKGWTEIMPTDWSAIMLTGLKELFKQIDANKVVAIGLTGQMHSTVFLTVDGEPLRPAIMWNDRRTKDLIQQLKRQLSEDPMTQLNSQIVSNGSPLANLFWLKENELANFKKLGKVLITKDYLNYCLTGNYATDYCDASSSSLYNFSNQTWSTEIFERYGFSADWFAEIYPAATVSGYLTDHICQRVGISEKIPVVVGTGDNVASTFATGSFTSNQPLISLGTSGVMIIPNKSYELKKIGKNVVAKIFPQDQTIITQGTVQAGGKLNSWWLDTILQTDQYLAEQEKIPIDLLGTNEVQFFPHLNGEKTLFANPNLRGAFMGLSLETERTNMYLAVLEGVAFGIRRLFEAMRNHEEPAYFSIVGGGAKSELWLKIFANVLNKPIRHILTTREAVHGAAMIASLATDQKIDLAEPEVEIIQPDPAIVGKYQKQYQKYLILSQLMEKYSEEVS